MHALKTLLIALLTICILPWGAYAAAWSAPENGRADMVSVWEKPGQGDHAKIAKPAPMPVITKSPKRCRTAILPGMRCGPDVALVSAHLRLDLTRSKGVTGAYEMRSTWRDLVQSPPMPPPRPI